MVLRLEEVSTKIDSVNQWPDSRIGWPPLSQVKELGMHVRHV